MSTKHIFNSSEGLVLKALRGAVALNPSLRLHSASKTVYVASSDAQPSFDEPTLPKPTVAVISGGGAGHEPAHAGYTGRGMLSASVSGDIFASPNANQILHTIYLASTGGEAVSEFQDNSQQQSYKDVLVIINNYTGDRLNFGLAIEKALSASSFKVESVVVADDVSLLPSASDSNITSRRSLVGTRGLGGNILVCKILGALADRGEPLARVKDLGDAVVHNLASVGVGLEHCHVPGRGFGVTDAMKLKEGEFEIGLGLHNEPGVTRKQMESPEKLVRDLLELIMRSKVGASRFLSLSSSGEDGDKAVVLLNNLGGMSQLEMNAILDEVLDQLEDLNVYPMRVYLSAYMTSLNAPGFSISLLNLSQTDCDFRASAHGNPPIDILTLLDEPTDAFAWVGVRKYWPLRSGPRDLLFLTPQLGHTHFNPPNMAQKAGFKMDAISQNTTRGIRYACQSVLRHQAELTDFDTVLGDGDCGETFASGARAILSRLDDKNVNIGGFTPHELVQWVSGVLEDSMGGTIGALFVIFFTAVSASLRDIEDVLTPILWGEVLRTGLNALSKHTPAKPGDRTLVDVLAPFCETLSDGSGFSAAVEAARNGAESSRSMQPVLGRAAYITVSNEVKQLPPDPGAWGVLAIVEGLQSGLLV